MSDAFLGRKLVMQPIPTTVLHGQHPSSLACPTESAGFDIAVVDRRGSYRTDQAEFLLQGLLYNGKQT